MASSYERSGVQVTFRSRLVIACIVTAILAFPGVSSAVFRSSPNSVALTVGSGSVAAPSGLVSLNGACVPGVSISASLSWVPSPSSFVDGYQIMRGTSAGGPYTLVATVGAGTTTYVDTSLAFLSSYRYVVRATKNNWRSANSNESSVVTLGPLCV